MLLLRWPGLFHMEPGKWRMKTSFFTFIRERYTMGKFASCMFGSTYTFPTVSELESTCLSLIQSMIPCLFLQEENILTLFCIFTNNSV